VAQRKWLFSSLSLLVQSYFWFNSVILMQFI
jgi:hypothetical protein